MKKLSATLPAIVATPHCPNSSTVIHCDECGCLTLAWIEDEKNGPLTVSMTAYVCLALPTMQSFIHLIQMVTYFPTV